MNKFGDSEFAAELANEFWVIQQCRNIMKNRRRGEK